MYVAKRSHTDKEGKLDSEPFHLTVLAKNFQGYLNLMKLTTIAHTEGYYYKPRVDRALLKKYHEGLIALSGCPSGEFIRSLDLKDLRKAEDVLKTYLDIFGEGNFYLEIQRHPYKQALETATDEHIRKDLSELLEIQERTFAGIKELSQSLGLPIAATNDCHYIKKEDAEAQDALLCIQTGKFLLETARLRMIDTPDYYLKTPQEMEELYRDLPQALENTVRIADSVNLEIPLGTARFPVFETPEGKSSMEYLREMTYKQAEEKIEITEKVKERLEYELGVIEQKKYADYFLVVADFMRWAHEKGIITNTRGSAAASMVLYCLGVTNLNPLDYVLPFERFLTVYRPSLPDIDADIADDRRDEILNYVMEKYGRDRVAHIVTFGTMMGRAAIRDVGRVLGMSYGDVDRIAKLVPPPHQGFHKPLPEAIKEVPDLEILYKNDSQIKKLLDLASKIEGTVRHASVHAAGVVIAPDEITNFTPLQRESSGERLVCQYDMFAVEDAGLVKMDLLGIRNLSILGRAVDLVKKLYDEDVDIERIPLDDKITFELLARGETEGLFQLNGDGMTRYLKELKPTTIHDINAMVALYRPGPMISIPDYIARKRDPSLIKYPDPRLKDILKESYGVIAYQDDVLLTAITLAGYSWLEADKLRKAMGKKIPKEMAAQEEKFISGCVDKGLRPEKALEIWKLIEPFAAYGFNKAHAASYGRVSYQTAYMKAHYPAPYMAAILSAESGDIDKVAEIITECKHMNISVLPPDVNESFGDFTVVKNKSGVEEIRFGLISTKNLGIDIAEAIITERKLNGKYVSFADFLTRVKHKNLNKKSLESLVKSGSMDKLGERGQLLANTEEALAFAHAISHVDSAQTSLFGGIASEPEATINLKPSEPAKKSDMLAWEKELLGLYVSGHPLDPWKEKLNGREMTIEKLKATYKEGMLAVVAGIVEESKEVITKTNDRMAFLKISDFTGTIEAVVFPKLYKDIKDLCIPDKCVVARGRISKRNDETSLIIEEIKELK